MGDGSLEIRPLLRRDGLHPQFIGPHRDGIAHPYALHPLDAPARGSQPEQRRAKARMGEGRAPGRARQAEGAGEAGAQTDPAPDDAAPDFHEGTDNEPDREADTSGREHRTAL